MIDQMAITLYTRVRSQGWRSQVWSALTGRSRCLLPLAKVDAAGRAHARGYVRIQTVPIRQIRGSEGRSKDFDRDFNPLQSHSRARWLGVATARQQGKALPPVELIQVGDVYFIRDGHHRISVARALGQWDIEAEVTVWQVTGPLSWERPAPLPSPASQAMETERLYRRVRDDGARLQKHLLLSIRALLLTAGAKLKLRIASQAGVGSL